ncbi:FRG domain-containing protein [Shewanella eurypsychrophilus]|uniref:FRG domain-containing protein n=1 Tax=Shewanella eurypsychrophilus TaxID=2593656 RepID=A0ABX6V8M2_9GAMM|nr:MULTISPECIES: FRG domain-containing protein [Shewanella]QFU22895.1 FRG domain-containing protein [Shewanella sp. YLB-09]QPG58181.1 FRG domain-containing protein [Shewanella eurypsychrophilus]
MKGQWIGVYTGSVDGKLMINVDETSTCYEAVTYIYPHNKDIPSSVAYLKTRDKSLEQELEANVVPIDPITGFPGQWKDIKKHYSDDIVHSDTSHIKLKLIGNKLNITSISDIGVELSSELEMPTKTDESKVIGQRMSWSEFKSHISDLTDSQYLYRGQKKDWRLRTTFHRGERYRISEFTRADVKQLHKRLSAITSHYFDLTVPEQNGAFFNLLQHHGYPTPLLDWSYSPYVAAFFAFRGWPINYSGEENVRIYLFNNKAWLDKYPQIQNIDPPYPHLSVMEFIAIDNPRLVPQQAITTVTNLDDIEAYILDKQEKDGIEYIKAIDISAKEREIAMSDLRFMGITAGSMFPSIDGVCEELRERNFVR